MNKSEKAMQEIESIYGGMELSHVRAFIYTGGGIDPKRIERAPGKNDITIAADSGYSNAVKLGIKVDFAVGDFDSSNEYGIPSDVERISVPAEKDFTDTMLAVDTAVEKGARDIVIIGGLDGRLDHTLSNMSILKRLSDQHIYATIEDGHNRVRYVDSTSTLIARSKYKYLSLIVGTEKAKGVSIEGCKYPLKNATLKCDNQYAISNEISGNVALISVKKGGIYVIESIDK